MRVSKHSAAPRSARCSPGWTAKWPPVWLTDSTRNSRSSRASCGSWRRPAGAGQKAGQWCRAGDSVRQRSCGNPNQNERTTIVSQRASVPRGRQMVPARQTPGRAARAPCAAPRPAQQARHRWVCRGRRLAGGFAQRGAVGFAVQHIVHHLEGRSPGKMIQPAHRSAGSASQASAPSSTEALDQRAGFGACTFQLMRWVQRGPPGGQINRPAAGHAHRGLRRRPAGAASPAGGLHAQLGRASTGISKAWSAGVAGQQRGGSSPNATWQVVLPRRSGRRPCTGRRAHQRIGVNHLLNRCRAARASAISAGVWSSPLKWRGEQARIAPGRRPAWRAHCRFSVRGSWSARVVGARPAVSILLDGGHPSKRCVRHPAPGSAA